MFRWGYVIGFSLVLLGGSEASAQTIYKREPPAGEIKAGQKILVDDGTCPKGQIKEVTGGTRINGMPGVKRTRTCVQRPK
jgi:hypothetical protein